MNLNIYGDFQICIIAHLTLTFIQQPNSCFKSGIKALPSGYLLVPSQRTTETPEQCVKYDEN